MRILTKVKAVTGAALATGSLALLTSAAIAPARAATTDDVWLKFDGPAGPVTSLTNLGTAPTTQTVVTASGGAANLAASYSGSGNALRLPALDNEKRAVVAISNAPGAPTDGLSPGGNTFRYGADFRLDTSNTGANGDGGNNILQRGISNGDPVHPLPQFKLQVDRISDKLQISCHIRAADKAEVVAQTTTTAGVAAETWYRAKCARTIGTPHDTVTLTVNPIAANGTLGAALPTVTGSGPIGVISFVPTVPLSIGGKLNSQPPYTVQKQSDQFNGSIDNAFLSID